MPDWTYYYGSYDTGTSTSTEFSVRVPTAAQMQQELEQYQRECERQDRIYEQQIQMLEQQMEEEMEKERQLIEDKRKYPLFFLKEGIV